LRRADGLDAKRVDDGGSVADLDVDLGAGVALQCCGRRRRRDLRWSRGAVGSLRGRTAAEWLAELSAVGVPCGVVKEVLEAIRESATASALTGMPSPVGGKTRFPPPKLDEHGAQIRDVGWGAFSGYREAASSS